MRQPDPDPIKISDEGFTVLNKVEKPTADIIIVHGLGGNAHDTWASKASALSQDAPAEKRSRLPQHKRRRRRFLCCGEASGDDEVDLVPTPASKSKHIGGLHWPRDLLPRDLGLGSSARILVWGYDSRITKGYAGSNKNGIFGHAKDLLYSLQREKPPRRPVIFVAHSLGGLIVKEVLRRSETSTEYEIQDIIRSTVGIIFLGTPHRGSPDLASLGDVVRRVAGATLRIDSNAVLLRSLGVDGPELELGRESFYTQWRTFGFKVKTFQEAFPISGVNVGPLNNKVVPDHSSSLDDPREHAETISANHMDMCRFSGASDPGYRKISAEIKLMIRSIEDEDAVLTPRGQELLRSLHFPAMYVRQKNIHVALDNTCNWLFSTTEYDDWIKRRNIEVHHGLLWIKGKPGAGKSTLMKEALHRTETKNSRTGTTTAGFFFNARGTEMLEKNPLGLYRSILHQVLQQDLRALSYFVQDYQRKMQTEGQIHWHEEDLQRFLFRTYASQDSRPAFIFIDALDECDEDEVRNVVEFLRDLTTKAWSAGAQLNVCLSSRHYPLIRIKRCPEVVVENHNEQDILEYIRTEAKYIATISKLQDKIFQKSSGVFLWAVLVVSMLKKSGHGKSLKWMESKLDEIPVELDTLFRKLFTQIDHEDAPKAVCLIQWILFAEERLKLSELHCILGFGNDCSYLSIRSWEESVDFLSSEQQLEMVITLSRGLVEPIASSDDADDPSFQFIHESVRDFFLKGDGFKLLDPSFEGSVPGKGNSSIAWTCVNFLQTSEIKAEAQRSRFMDNDKNTDRGGLFKDYMLLRYVGCYLFTHIEAAERCGVTQEELFNRLLSNGSEIFEYLQPLFAGVVVKSLQRSATEATTIPASAPATYEPNETILYHCCKRSRGACALRLIQMGADVNERTATAFRFPLIGAVSTFWPSKATEDTVEILLESDANPNLHNQWTSTALHVAAARSTPKVVQMLLDHGADVTAVDSDGETAADRARLQMSSARDEIERCLLDHGGTKPKFEEHGSIVGYLNGASVSPVK